MEKHPDDHGKPVKVKISGDGARMTRNSSFISLNFVLLRAGDDVMSSKENHTIDIMKGKEDYQTLQISFVNVFQDINSEINEQKIVIDGITIDLSFIFLGGDYKFILLMMGLKGATSHYAYVWCKLHKDDR